MKIINIIIATFFILLNAYSQDCLVKSVKGSAFLTRRGIESPLVVGSAVVNEDGISVRTGSVTVNCSDKSIVILKANTRVKLRYRANTPETIFNFISPSYPSRTWEITSGKIVARVFSPVDTKVNTFFSTHDTVVTAKGTDLSISLNNGTTVYAIKGTVAGADAGRTMTYILNQGVQGNFRSQKRGFFSVRSIKGDFSVSAREAIISLESGESAYLSADRVTGRIDCRVPKDSAGGVVITSGEVKLIVNPEQETSVDITAKNTAEIGTGMENVGDLPLKAQFCGTKALLKAGARAMLLANKGARTLTVSSHSGKLRVELSDGRIVDLEGGQTVVDNCGIPVAEVVPPVEPPASPIKP